MPKKVNKSNCCVYGCHTRKERDKGTFHLFPHVGKYSVYTKDIFGGVIKMDRRKAWVQALLMGKHASNYMRVCGQHFKKEDYGVVKN